MAAGLLLRVRRRPAEAAGDQGAGGVALEQSRIFAPGALDGCVALVTGGGTNLGKAAAAELVRCGAEVVIAGRRPEVLEEAARELGERCTWVAGDVREREAAEAIVRAVLDRHGRLDLLLNNAGGQYFVPAEGITAKGWRAVTRLNVGGTLNMCEAAHRLALRDSGGTIVNVTVSPHHGMPAMAHTGAARAAVEALTHEFAREWAGDGVTIAAIALGRLATESLRKYPAELWRRAAESVPLQRLGEVEEYGWLVALLATPMGRAFSGSVVTLDGALDNWAGPWPPPDLTRGGQVPTEERVAPGAGGIDGTAEASSEPGADTG
ncbi:MAG TPA: SDR family oxidoreductase [Solirubrobacteraceae bacterium]